MNQARLTLLLAVAAIFLITQCGDAGPPCDSVGNDSSCVGGGCLAAGECVASCQTGGEFPGGMCTYACGRAEDCPNGSTCVSLDSVELALCLPMCDSSDDCRSGYSCQPQARVGTTEFIVADVCIGGLEP